MNWNRWVQCRHWAWSEEERGVGQRRQRPGAKGEAVEVQQRWPWGGGASRQMGGGIGQEKQGDAWYFTAVFWEGLGAGMRTLMTK